MTDTPRWHFGNAGVDGEEHQGGLVGAFLDPEDIRMTADVEIKWGMHAAGERREAWFEEERRTTLVVLIAGRVQIELPVGNAMLSEQGDYAIWGPGMGHAWRAEEDSVVVTINWPADSSR